MITKPARRIPREQLPARLTPVGSSGQENSRRYARVILRPEVEAEARAQAIIERAKAEASLILERAEQAASSVQLVAEAEGRANGAATVAAQAIRLAALERAADQRQLERSVGLARVLAERLLGAELQLAPERVLDLARTALRETGGARQVVIHAHPDDARALEAGRESLGLSRDAVRIASDPSRSQGNLRLDTEIGVLDAELAPQLARLALKLRETLGG